MNMVAKLDLGSTLDIGDNYEKFQRIMWLYNIQQIFIQSLFCVSQDKDTRNMESAITFWGLCQVYGGIVGFYQTVEEASQ